VSGERERGKPGELVLKNVIKREESKGHVLKWVKYTNNSEQASYKEYQRCPDKVIKALEQLPGIWTCKGYLMPKHEANNASVYMSHVGQHYHQPICQVSSLDLLGFGLMVKLCPEPIVSAVNAGGILCGFIMQHPGS